VDVSGFEEIYRLYFQDVYKFLFALCRDRALAEELTQDTFFKAMKSCGSFRGDCKITTWLCQIAKNTLFLHQKQRRRESGPEPEESAPDPEEPVELLFDQRDQALKIHRVLHWLPEPYKEVFSLRILGELPFRDIGALFCKTEGWARVTFHRAKLKLTTRLKEKNDG